MKSKPTYQELEKENEILRQKLKISENNEKFKNFFDNNKAIMLQVDFKTKKIINANESAANFYGYSKNDLIKKTIYDLHTLLPSEIEKLMKKALKMKSNFFQFKHKLANGTIKDIEVYSSPLKNANETHMIITVYDITNRKKTEQILKESEEKFKRFFNFSPNPMAITDIEGKLVNANMAFYDITQYSKKEIIGKTSTEIGFYNKKKREVFLQKINSLGKVKGLEMNFVLKDNTVITAEMYAIIIHIEDNPYILSTFVDITNRKKEEQSLKKSEAIFRDLFDFIPIIIYEVDITGKFIFVNKQAFNSFGYTDEIYKNELNVINTIIPEDRKRATKIMQNIFLKKNNEATEYTGLRKDGSTFPILVYSNAIIKDNKPIGIRGAIVDLTERKKAEQGLKESEKKLKESNKTKDKFFSIIAHDLRSPFNALLGLSDILLDNHKKYNDEEREEIIKLLNSSANKAFNLLENLLTWSLSQSGQIKYLPEILDFNTLVFQTSSNLQAQANKKDIEISNTISKNKLIYADKNMITTVLRNLISNAIKFTNRNGKVVISSNKQTNSNFIEISVTDTGVGIPKDKIDNLFRIDKDTSTAGTEDETGTGLGLILCKEFVDKHNGKIWVESKIGKGTTFYFTIPYKTTI